MSSWKKPTQEQIDLVLDNLKGNLKQQFFAKLENPEWFEVLNQKNLLWYTLNINDSGQEYKEWTAFPYLLKIAPEIPDQIIKFIQPMLQEIKESQHPEWWLIEQSIFLSTKLPDDHFEKIMHLFNESLKKLEMLGWLDNDILKQILTRLKNINKELVLDISRNLLSIKLTKDTYSIGTSFSPAIKLTNAGWGYEKIIKIVNNIFADSKDELLKLYVSIIVKDMVSDLSSDEICKYYATDWLHRSAIEKHPQDLYKQSSPLYILISEIRDISLEILQNRDATTNQKIFELLENSNCPTLTRIILYLLRVGDKYHKDLLAKYLTNKDMFDSSVYHHEYYLLVQDKFNQLPKKAQKIILDYIDEGPDNEYYQKDEQNLTSQQKKNYWRLHKLIPIKQHLSPDILKKYQSILYDKNGNEVKYGDHPDMLCWMEEGTTSSPLDIKELKEKSVEEIINFVNSWEPDNTDINISEIGLAEVIRKDATSNSEKYLNNLEKTKKIQDPTYIHYMLSGLKDVKKISNTQWQNIIDFSQWIINQNNVFENQHSFYNGDSDWYNSKSVIADLLSKAFKYKENLPDITDEYINKAFSALKQLCFMEDKYLEKKAKEEREITGLGDYLSSAINALHGKSVEGLVFYLIWKKNNKKTLDDVIPIIDKLFSKPVYIETYAIFAHMLPWIHYAAPTVVENNIDNLFPEEPEKRSIFEAVFATYIDYSQIFNSMFSILEPKFAYVLNNQIYSNTEQTKTEDAQISKILSIYYGRGIFDLNSNLIRSLFNNTNNYQKQVEFVKYIGFSMWNQNTSDQVVNKEVIERFVKFWEWLIQKTKGKETEYKEILSQFERWYQCDQFDKEWVISQLHSLVINYDIFVHLFMIKENLLRDLPKYPRKIFDIISKLICSKQQRLYISGDAFIENIVKYIHENNFSDDPRLKSDKDKFINKYLESCEAWQVDTETEKLSKYLEN